MKLVVAVLIVLVGLTPSADAEAGGNPTLRLGSTGDAVVVVQQRLIDFGYTLTTDGQFGKRTDRAVRHFQKANRLRVDGIVGKLTWRALTSQVPATVEGPPSPVPSRAPAPPPGDVEQIIREVWPDHLEDEAVRIAYRESRHVPTARNACCHGLFQIYFSVHRSWLAALGVTSVGQLYDPRTNATAALVLYERNGWAPWRLG